MQNYVDDDSEDTLSFCDLQFCHENIDASGDNSLESSLENDQSSSSNSLFSSSVSDLELFEFFTGWNSTSASFSFNTSTTVSDDINFCGELNIPHKQSESDDPKNEFPQGKIPKKYTKNIFEARHSDTSFNRRSKTTPPRSNSSPPVPASYSNIPKGNSSSKKDILSKRVSMLSSSNSSTTKSLWFLFMFGLTSPSTVPKKMELSDLRNRQSRRNPSTMFCSVDEAVVGEGYRENTVRKYSFGCFGGL